MGNSLRCCLACVLPCGALDLIRIVHLNGNVDESTGPITAGEVLKKNPGHILTKPSSQGVVRKILILSPESELKRGSIYFLIPDSSVPAASDKSKKSVKKYKSAKQQIASPATAEKKEKKVKKTTSSHRRKVSVGGWQPHLESISEDL